MSEAIDALKAELDVLNVKHADIVAQVDVLRAQREVFNLQVIAAQEQAAIISDQMRQIYDDSDFFALASRRGKLADAIMSLKQG